MKLCKCLLVIVAANFVAETQFASAALITLVNADFDSGYPFGPGYSTTIAGWVQHTPADSGTLNTDSYGYSPAEIAAHKAAAYNGQWFDTDWVTQQVADTFINGAQYTFSIELDSVPSQYNDPTNVGGRLMLGYMNGSTLVQLATQDVLGTSAPGTFDLVSMNYTATAADVGKQIVVGFKKLQLPEYHQTNAWDNAALDVEGVPEPSSAALLGIGAVLISICHRKRRLS